MKQKIFLMTAFHKNYFNIDSKDFFPIHVGKKLSNVDLGIVGDDTGDNISDKNKNFCELTALYWAWKNVDAEYYGLMHYRRYFYLKKSCFDTVNSKLIKTRKMIKSKLKKKYVFNYKFVKNIQNKLHATKEIGSLHRFLEDQIFNYDIILPEARYLKVSLAEDYSGNHLVSDMIEIKKILGNKFPTYLEDFEIVMNKNKLYAYNMFIMKKQIFEEYMEWLFTLLFELERIITISDRELYQARVFGFLSERLLIVFLQNYERTCKRLKILELPIMFFDFE